MTLRRWATACAVAVLVGVGLLWTARQRAAKERHAAGAFRLASARAAAEAEVRESDIAFYARRIAEDPTGALDRTRLAALYLQRARETSDYGDYLRADSVARQSLALGTAHNASAYAVLSSALLAQHRFVEARDAARQLVAAEPAEDAYRSMLGEACLEVGDYTCARIAFDSISAIGRASLAVAPRLARWAEIRGDTATARRLIRGAFNSARQSTALSREQAAWFHLHAADFELRYRRPARARDVLQEGLAQHPGDHRLLAAMARAHAALGDWRSAIEFGDSAIVVALDPSTLGVVSDAYAALGDTAQAAQYFRAMEVAVGQQPGTYHRAWSLFLLDHGQRVSDVLTAAQAEIAGRTDVYGYDLLAWALFKSGRLPEAESAMQLALAQGTKDPLLLGHAAAIRSAAPGTTAARATAQR